VFDSQPLGNEAADELVGDSRVAGVCLTGSETAGAAVAGAAGRGLKKSVLELGGSDPFIVLEDADIGAAAEAAAQSRFRNAGQVCISAKRMIVDAKVHDDFLDAFVAASRAYEPGDPEREETRLGPMARRDLRDTICQQVERSLAAGARAVVRGGAVEGEGAFCRPTIAAEVPPDSPLAVEESFGPAAAVFMTRGEGEAVALANATRFGLSANLWTGDPDRADRLAPRIEAGGVFVNATTASDPRVPFGGIKASGYGRELGREGIREFVNLKTVWLARA
jgi:succinate-semialdehyde dehydrogenase/glutarate-semialdehyde dehydrogenase